MGDPADVTTTQDDAVSAPALLGPQQLGFVVPDVHRAVRIWFKEYGVGPWTVFLVVPEDPETFGVAEPYSMRVAVANWGPVQIELLEPVSGDTDYARSLAAHDGRPHLHHIKSGYEGDLDSAVGSLEDRGHQVILRGNLPGASRFAYTQVDGEGVGCVVELTQLADPFKFPEIEEIYPSPE
jgi:hypothetical protein